MTSSGSLPSLLTRTIFDAQKTETTPGEKVRSEGQGPVADAAVNRVYDNLGVVHEFYSTVYGRDSLTHNHEPLRATVHFSRGNPEKELIWTGTQLLVPEGFEPIFGDLTLGLDLLANTISRQLFWPDAPLTNQGQSGALLNSIGDVFGSLVQQYARQQNAEQADWLIGADVLTPGIAGDALRSLKAPGTAYDHPLLGGKDPQPAHMDDYAHAPHDNGGVHANSGIPNHAFYLLATKWGGNAWERAGKVWYDALTSRSLRSDATFADFARLTTTTAATLYGDSESRAVKEAWNKVGVA
ncbi:M4 family metallopeptidase [Streptomyces anulatus]